MVHTGTKDGRGRKQLSENDDLRNSFDALPSCIWEFLRSGYGMSVSRKRKSRTASRVRAYFCLSDCSA